MSSASSTSERPEASRSDPASVASLTPLFSPASIAVVGASPDVSRPGGRCLAYLARTGYAGRVYPVNPRYDEVQGLRAYPSIEALPEAADLAVLIIPAPAIPDTVEAAGRRGVRGIVVCSSGFAEAGADGKALEERLRAAAANAGVALLGPNCLGYFDARTGAAATFSTALQLAADGPSGGIALVSQSGALGAGIFSIGRSAQVGLSLFVSTGNEACLGVADVIGHLAHEPEVSTILSYIEGMRDGRRFIAAAREARKHGKRVIAIKVGRTDAGRRASRSHTGALAGADELWEAAFRRGGVVVAQGMEDLLDAGVALDLWSAPVGPRLGIVSMSGGAGALMADHAAQAGLTLPQFGDETVAALSRVLPAFAGMSNPVDYGAIYGDPDAIERTLRTVLATPETDAVALFIGLTPGYVGQLEDRLATVAADAGKPLFITWLGAPLQTLARLRGAGMPAYADPSRMIDAIAALVRASAPLPCHLAVDGTADTGIRGALEELLAAGINDVPEATMKQLLAESGLPVVAEQRVRTATEARAFAAQLGGPVAVKVDAVGLLHKSDIGGVLLNVDDEDVERAFAQVVAAGRGAGYEVHGAVVSQMARPGLELIVGGRWDEQFGPTVLVGAGGVTAEVLADAQVELAPCSVDQARTMLESLRIAPLLRGYRGESARDVQRAAGIIAAVSRLMAQAGGLLRELDLNPVVVYPEGEGALIVDAVAVLASP